MLLENNIFSSDLFIIKRSELFIMFNCLSPGRHSLTTVELNHYKDKAC